MTQRFDDFNRANGALGTPSDGGSAWVDPSSYSGPPTISGNKAAGSSVNGMAYLEFSDADFDLAADVASGSRIGFCLRVIDRDNFIEAVFDGSTNTIQAYYYIAGSGTSLASVSFTRSGSTVYRLRAVGVGTALTISVDGVTKVTATMPAAFNGRTKHGLRMAGSPATGTWDNFNIVPVVNRWTVGSIRWGA